MFHSFAFLLLDVLSITPHRCSFREISVAAAPGGGDNLRGLFPAAATHGQEASPYSLSCYRFGKNHRFLPGRAWIAGGGPEGFPPRLQAGFSEGPAKRRADRNLRIPGKRAGHRRAGSHSSRV